MRGGRIIPYFSRQAENSAPLWLSITRFKSAGKLAYFAGFIAGKNDVVFSAGTRSSFDVKLHQLVHLQSRYDLPRQDRAVDHAFEQRFGHLSEKRYQRRILSIATPTCFARQRRIIGGLYQLWPPTRLRLMPLSAPYRARAKRLTCHVSSRPTARQSLATFRACLSGPLTGRLALGLTCRLDQLPGMLHMLRFGLRLTDAETQCEFSVQQGMS